MTGFLISSRLGIERKRWLVLTTDRYTRADFLSGSSRYFDVDNLSEKKYCHTRTDFCRD